MVATNYAEKAERLLEGVGEELAEDRTDRAQVLATMALAYATLAVSTTTGGTR